MGGGMLCQCGVSIKSTSRSGSGFKVGALQPASNQWASLCGGGSMTGRGRVSFPLGRPPPVRDSQADPVTRVSPDKSRSEHAAYGWFLRRAVLMSCKAWPIQGSPRDGRRTIYGEFAGQKIRYVMSRRWIGERHGIGGLRRGNAPEVAGRWLSQELHASRQLLTSHLSMDRADVDRVTGIWHVDSRR